MREEENTFPSPASPEYNTSSMFWEEKYVPPLHLDTCLPLLPSLPGCWSLPKVCPRTLSGCSSFSVWQTGQHGQICTGTQFVWLNPRVLFLSRDSITFHTLCRQVSCIWVWRWWRKPWTCSWQGRHGRRPETLLRTLLQGWKRHLYDIIVNLVLLPSCTPKEEP